MIAWLPVAQVVYVSSDPFSNKLVSVGHEKHTEVRAFAIRRYMCFRGVSEF
jgi:hypothetical protein